MNRMRVVRAPGLDAARDEDARLVEDDQGQRDGQGSHDGIADRRDYFREGKEDEIGDPPLFPEQGRPEDSEPYEDYEHAGHLESDPAGQEEEDHEGQVLHRRGKVLHLSGKELDEDADHSPEEIVPESGPGREEEYGRDEEGEKAPLLLLLQSRAYEAQGLE